MKSQVFSRNIIAFSGVPTFPGADIIAPTTNAVGSHIARADGSSFGDPLCLRALVAKKRQQHFSWQLTVGSWQLAVGGQFNSLTI